MDKMPLGLMQRHISEFDRMGDNRKPGDGRRFLARGSQLRTLTEFVAKRLELGWTYLEDHPQDIDAEDHWYGLLEIYEKANDVLDKHGVGVDRVSSAKLILDAHEVDDGEQST